MSDELERRQRTERDERQVDELMRDDEALRQQFRSWSKTQVEVALLGAIIACRMVDRQLEDLRSQVRELGAEPRG